MSVTQPSFEISTEMRDFAEKGVEQSRSAFITFVQNARKAMESAQAQTKTAELPISVAYVRGLEFFEQNLASTFDLAQKLVRANNLQDALQLQSEYVRTQFAALQSQAKELASTAQPTKAA
ncbi:phasin family protein [Methylobacterium sp. CM6257]|jgi:phasin